MSDEKPFRAPGCNDPVNPNQTQTVLLSKPVLRQHVVAPVMRAGYKLTTGALAALLALFAIGMGVRDAATFAREHDDDAPVDCNTTTDSSAIEMCAVEALVNKFSGGLPRTTPATPLVDGCGMTGIDIPSGPVSHAWLTGPTGTLAVPAVGTIAGTGTLTLTGWIDPVSHECGDYVAGVTVLDVDTTCTAVHVVPSSARTMGADFGDGAPPRVEIVGLTMRDRAGVRQDPADGQMLSLVSDGVATLYGANADAPAGDRFVLGWELESVNGQIAMMPASTAVLLAYDGKNKVWRVLASYAGR